MKTGTYWLNLVLVCCTIALSPLHAEAAGVRDWGNWVCRPFCAASEDGAEWTSQTATVYVSKLNGLQSPPAPIPGDACPVQITYRRMVCTHGGDGRPMVHFTIESIKILCERTTPKPPMEESMQQMIMRLMAVDDPLNLVLEDDESQYLSINMPMCWRQYRCVSNPGGSIIYLEMLVPCSVQECCSVTLYYEGANCAAKRFFYPSQNPNQPPDERNGGFMVPMTSHETSCTQEVVGDEVARKAAFIGDCVPPSSRKVIENPPCGRFCISSFNFDMVR